MRFPLPHPIFARLAPLAACAIALSPAPSAAHNGAVVAKAVFCAPPPPSRTPTDGGGVDYHYLPRYVPEEADQRYHLAWQDGDMDPTGKFTFFFLDHDVPISLRVDYIDGTGGAAGIGKIVKTIDGREARDVYVSCACVSQDLGGGEVCDSGTMAGTNCADGGARWCDNGIDWDTSQVPDGVYWIAAVNNDPPYHVYNMSEAPVRVSHAAHKPPAVMVVKPDGFGSADSIYRVTALVAGAGPLTMSVAYGIDVDPQVTNPVHVIASKLPLTPTADGTVTYEWDVSRLPNSEYFVEVTISDDSGASSFSDSRYGIGVFHAAPASDLGAPHADLAAAAADLAQAANPMGKAGCSCAIGGAAAGGVGGPSLPGERSTPAAGRAAWAMVGFLAAALFLTRFRRAALRGARSGCTGSGT